MITETIKNSYIIPPNFIPDLGIMSRTAIDCHVVSTYNKSITNSMGFTAVQHKIMLIPFMTKSKTITIVSKGRVPPRMSNAVVKGSVVAISATGGGYIESVQVKVVRLYPVEFKIVGSIGNANSTAHPPSNVPTATDRPAFQRASPFLLS